MYIDKLGHIVNGYHSIIKLKPFDVKSKTYIESGKEINNKYPKFKISDIVRMWKHKSNFAKDYSPNLSEHAFVIKKVKITLLWTHVINDLNGKEIVGTFYKKELQKEN